MIQNDVFRQSHHSPDSHSSHSSCQSHSVKKSLFSPQVVAVCEPHTGHALAQVTLFDELLLQGLELLVDEVVGLMNQANRDVSDALWRTGLHKLTIEFEGLRCHAPQPPDEARLLGILVPEGVVPHAEVVEVIPEQFLQTGPADVGELDFHFLGSLRGAVQLAGASGVLVEDVINVFEGFFEDERMERKRSLLIFFIGTHDGGFGIHLGTEVAERDQRLC